MFADSCMGHLPQFVRLVRDQPFTWTGFFCGGATRGKKQKGDTGGWGNKADTPPKMGTQSWCIRHEAVLQLCSAMKNESPDDIDMWFIGRNPWGDKMAYLSQSVSGQGVGTGISECQRSNATHELTNRPIAEPQWGDYQGKPMMYIRTYEENPGWRQETWSAHLSKTKKDRQRIWNCIRNEMPHSGLYRGHQVEEASSYHDLL